MSCACECESCVGLCERELCGVWIVHRNELCGSCEYGQCQGLCALDGVRDGLGSRDCVWDVERRRVTGDSALPRVNTLDPTVGQAGLGATALPGDELASDAPGSPRQGWIPAPRHTAGPQPSPQHKPSRRGGQRGALGPDLAPPLPWASPSPSPEHACHGSWVCLDPWDLHLPPRPGPLCRALVAVMTGCSAPTSTL